MSMIKRKYETHPAPDHPKTGEKQVDVYFPKGHSVRLTMAEAARRGVLNKAPRVHMALGEEIPESADEGSLRVMSEQITKRNQRPGSGDLEEELLEGAEQE